MVAAFVNGQVPAGLLVPAAGVSGARLRPGTASRWAAIRDRVHARYGWWPEITSAGDGYRDIARQETLFRRNYTTTNTGHGPVKSWDGSLWWRRTADTPSAAVPGTSNHGKGTTADVVNLGTLNQFTTVRYQQFAAVAIELDFSNAEGRSIGEPWHWSDTLDPDVATGGAAPQAPTQEDDMTAQFESDVRADLLQKGALLGSLDADVRGDLLHKGEQLDSIVSAVQGLPALDRDLRADLIVKGQQITALTATVQALSGLIGHEQGLDVQAVRKAVSDAIAGLTLTLVPKA